MQVIVQGKKLSLTQKDYVTQGFDLLLIHGDFEHARFSEITIDAMF